MANQAFSPTFFAVTVLFALVLVFFVAYIFTNVANYTYDVLTNVSSTISNMFNVTSTIIPQPSTSSLTSGWSYIIDAAAGVIIIGFLIGIARVRHT